MAVHELAGKPAPRAILVNVPRLISAYYTMKPDMGEATERVAFGTSGHRGSSFRRSFNEGHILATTQAICDYRKMKGINGPLFLGMDTHALSEPSYATALEVLAANGIDIIIQKGMGYTPTPAISHAILVYNRGRLSGGLADGIVITPSHNPPEDGGFKYNPPHGGPADTDVTRWVEERANGLLKLENRDVKRIPFERALRGSTTHERDFVMPYVEDLRNILDMEAIRASGVKIGVDPLGGAAVAYWEPIAATYGIDMELVNPVVDPTFSFMTVDKDGKIRMDCSSPYAMASLIELRDKYDVAFGNDTDCDRHGKRRPHESQPLPFRGHLVPFSESPAMAQRNGGRKDSREQQHDRPHHGSDGEESFRSTGGIQMVCGWPHRRRHRLRRGGERRSLLSSQGRDGVDDGQGRHYHGPAGRRDHSQDGPGPRRALHGAHKDLRQPRLRADRRPGHTGAEGGAQVLVSRDDCRIDPGRLPDYGKTHPRSGQRRPIGGLKVVTEDGWFAARPSGTEDVYKIYTESFKGRKHLEQIQEEARAIVSSAFRAAGA